MPEYGILSTQTYDENEIVPSPATAAPHILGTFASLVIIVKSNRHTQHVCMCTCCDNMKQNY